jgi:hypothetical protein
MTFRKIFVPVLLLAPLTGAFAEPPVDAPPAVAPAPLIQETAPAVVETPPVQEAVPPPAETIPAVVEPAQPAPPPSSAKVVPTPAPTPEIRQAKLPHPAPTMAGVPPADSQVVTPTDFREISISIRPGYLHVQKNPGGWSDSALGFTAEVTMFLHRRLGVNLPYTYNRYTTPTVSHSVGGGPVFRYLDTDHFRASIGANALFVRAAHANHLGWSALTDLMFGFRRSAWRPFFGPFFRYDYVYLPGDNLREYTIGGGLTLTELADWE